MTLAEMVILLALVEAVLAVVMYGAGYTDGSRERRRLCRHWKRHGDCLSCWVKGIR